MIIPNRDKEREKIVKMTEEDMKVFMAKHYPEYVSINDTPFAQSILDEYKAKVREAIDKLQDKYDLCEKRSMIIEPIDRMKMLAKVKILEDLKRELGLE